MLTFDEKPLQCFNALKDTDNDISFVLKQKHVANTRHVDIRKDTKEQILSRTTTTTKTTFQPHHAVAIYDYEQKQTDELDVSVSDRFIVLSRDPNTNWCVVERNGKRGWVPGGCLLEDEGPPKDDLDTTFSRGDKRVLTGVVLYDFDKITPNELTVRKGNVLVIHKVYMHWILADVNNKRGWVPSSYVSFDDDDLKDGGFDVRNLL